jgi:hypothetical protein
MRKHAIAVVELVESQTGGVADESSGRLLPYMTVHSRQAEDR